ncbi:hypothetical protein [Roseibium suaedae]|nr:hypothetical protein [Roseibium suaedae]
MAGMLVWDYATGLPRALPTFEWQHITLAALFFLFTMYLYRWLLLSFLWGKFGARVIEVGDRVVMSNKLFNVKVKYKSFRMAKVVSAEVCHRDDGKTDGTAETPEPGQYFVRLRFPSTTFMITDWIEKSEAAAIAEGINQRLPDGRTI